MVVEATDAIDKRWGLRWPSEGRGIVVERPPWIPSPHVMMQLLLLFKIYPLYHIRNHTGYSLPTGTLMPFWLPQYAICLALMCRRIINQVHLPTRWQNFLLALL